MLELLLVLFLYVFRVGLVLLPAWARELRGFASMERRRVGAMLGTTIPEHYVPLDVDPNGAHVRMVARIRRAVPEGDVPGATIRWLFRFWHAGS